jgi:hypothetical protein
MPPAVYKDVRVLSFRHVGEPQDLENAAMLAVRASCTPSML